MRQQIHQPTSCAAGHSALCAQALMPTTWISPPGPKSKTDAPDLRVPIAVPCFLLQKDAPKAGGSSTAMARCSHRPQCFSSCPSWAPLSSTRPRQRACPSTTRRPGQTDPFGTLSVRTNTTRSPVRTAALRSETFVMMALETRHQSKTAAPGTLEAVHNDRHGHGRKRCQCTSHIQPPWT